MIPPRSLLKLQRNKWSCGPCALRHALLCHRRGVSVEMISDLSGITHAFNFKYDTTPRLRNAAWVTTTTREC